MNGFTHPTNLAMRLLGVFVLLALVGLLASSWFIKNELHKARVWHRPCVDDTPEQWGFTAEEYRRVEFQSLDGLTLDGLYFPVENPKGIVVATHGLADEACAEFMLPLVPPLVEAGFGAFLPTLRNFGGSEGTLTSIGRTEWQDLAGAALWLRQDVSEEVPITLLGLSMGGGTALIAGAKGYGDSLVVLNPYTREVPGLTWIMKTRWGVPEELTTVPATAGMLAEYGPGGFDTQPLDYVEREGIDQPVLIIGGRRDQILPPRLLPDLLEAIGDNATLQWVDARHNLVREDARVTAIVIDHVLGFLKAQL